jgi:hypothetical protein
MLLRGLRVLLPSLLLVLAASLFSDQLPRAEAATRVSGDLFYNYYAPPGPCGGAAAAMYPCPRPTPVWVGHTYVTYPPFMPHEFLYKHSRRYSRYHPGSGWTVTRVLWK